MLYFVEISIENLYYNEIFHIKLFKIDNIMITNIFL